MEYGTNGSRRQPSDVKCVAADEQRSAAQKVGRWEGDGKWVCCNNHRKSAFTDCRPLGMAACLPRGWLKRPMSWTVRSAIEFSPLREERAGRGRGRGTPADAVRCRSKRDRFSPFSRSAGERSRGRGTPPGAVRCDSPKLAPSASSTSPSSFGGGGRVMRARRGRSADTAPHLLRSAPLPSAPYAVTTAAPAGSSVIHTPLRARSEASAR
jgi:hypothetical protein